MDQGRVWVVDDDPQILQAIDMVLRSESYEVAAYETGEALIRALESDLPDSLILDLGLPDMDGYEVLEHFSSHAHLKNIPVIVLTGWTGDDLLLKALELGALEFLNKPFRSAELLARVRNILYHKKLRDRLEVTNRLLDEAKVKAEIASKVKTEFLGMMSHEFRTPLNGILAAANLLDHSFLDDEKKELVEMVRMSGSRLLEMVNEILDLSRLEAGDLSPEEHEFILRSPIEDVIDLYYHEAEVKKIDLVYSLSRDCPDALVGDSGLLRQILAHLVHNAVKFTNEGAIHLSVFKTEPEEASMGDGSIWLEFELADSGIGVERNDKERIFQSFVHGRSGGDRIAVGAGLGLAICQRIVMLLGGKVWVESNFNGGSVFHFKLRFQRGKDRQKAGLIPREGPGKKVGLLIQPGSLLESVKNMTERMGWKTVVCDSIQAVQAAEFEVLLADLRRFPDAVEALGKMMKPLVGLVGNLDQRGLTDTDLRSLAKLPLKFEHLASILAGARQTAQRPEQKEPAPEVAARKPRILLVDDNQINLRIGCKLLERMGLSPDMAANGKEALEMLEKLDYDIVFMDVQMPVMDGLTATREIRKMESSATGQRLFIVGLSAGLESEERNKALGSGMDCYLAKPLMTKNLEQCLLDWRHLGKGSIHASKGPAEEKDEVKPTGILLDPSRLMEMAENDVNEAASIVESLFDQSEKHLAEMKKMVESGDLDGVRVKAHSMAGAAGTCGFPLMASTAKALEHRIDAGEKGGFSDEMIQIEKIIHESRGEFEKSFSPKNP